MQLKMRKPVSNITSNEDRKQEFCRGARLRMLVSDVQTRHQNVQDVSLKYTGECRPGLNKAPSYWARCVKQLRFLSYHIPPTNHSSIRRYSLAYWSCRYNKPHIGTGLLKTTVHWYVTPYTLVRYTDVSEKSCVTIIRVEYSWRQQAPLRCW